MQNRETEHKTLIDTLQEEKKMLSAKFQDLDNQGSTANYDKIEQDNKNLQARVNEM